MKKNKLTKLALLGLAHGLILNGQVVAESEKANIEQLIASNPQAFEGLNGEAKTLLNRLSSSESTTSYLAAKCGAGKCSQVANKCGAGKCSAVASKCGAGKCSTVANKCGAGKCSTVAAKCGAGKCSTVAAKCGAGKCSTVAAKCGAGKCSTVAAKCGAGKCSTVAAKCGAGKCSTVAAKCGAGKCATIAQRDTATTNLQDPSKVDLKGKKSTEYDPNSENFNYHMMTEQELLLELNDEGVRIFKSLSPEGKKLALTVASQACNGTNECKGLNACKTDKNDCAGKGSCKGESKCAISDKNLAVKLVYQKMAAKRAGAIGR